MKPVVPKIVLVAVVLIFSVYTGLLLYGSWPIENWTIATASIFGDSFGALSSLFSALAFVMIVWTIALQQQELRLQRQELRLQRDEMSKMTSTQVRQLHISLQMMAIQDPTLIEVWANRMTSVEPSQKQLSYINLIVSHWEMQFIEGMLTPDQVRSTVKHYFSTNQYFKSYWKVSGPKRKTMSDDGTAQEKAFYEILNRSASGA